MSGPRTKRTPRDWPGRGPIDLARHDAPHPSSDTEWWYVHSHFTAADGRALALFAAFFRIAAGRDETTGERTHAHALTWALSDPTSGRYFAESRVDESAPKMAIERIDTGRGSRDPLLNRAMREILERGQIPTPDRFFEGPVSIGLDRLSLDFGGARFDKQADGSYRLQLTNGREGIGCDLVFRPRKAAIRHGDDGVVPGVSGEDMFYYFIPRCDLEGSVTLDGVAQSLAGGEGWYDHEFGGHAAPEASVESGVLPEASDGVGGPHRASWNWIAIQLRDGTDVSAYEIVDRHDGDAFTCLVLIDPDGQRRTSRSFTLEPGRMWHSTRTFREYPVSWQLRVPEFDLDLTIEAVFDDQEFLTVISKPAFWEGRCAANGRLAGRPVTGNAYVERTGFDNIEDLDDFFTEVGKEVRRSISQVMPLEPSYEQLRALVASKEFDRYMDGVDVPSLARTLIAPVREITDRGGKSWRSYASLACCDVVGGDSRKFVQWLAIPELMHVGSLIVDDIQDGSMLRRGGPSCHVVYGQAVAINAGTAAYFMTQQLLVSNEIPAERTLRLYDLYFQAMRAGHAGQAIDLGGLEALMPGAVETGDVTRLEQRILACHRLKTAVPAASLARMGAVAGGGSDVQIDAVGTFFEAMGMAFQIIDDVLNLRGFKGGLKNRGEDIANGSITLPIAKALARLEREERQHVWDTLRSKPSDAAVIAGMVDRLEMCGALDACVGQARQLIEDGWARTEVSLEPSLSRVMLRAFGWFVLERHY